MKQYAKEWFPPCDESLLELTNFLARLNLQVAEGGDHPTSSIHATNVRHLEERKAAQVKI